jgi:ComF family protein
MLKLIHTVLNLIFPQKCVGCGNNDEKLICEKCERSILKISITDKIKENLCCHLDNLIVAADYKNPAIKKAIWLLKYRGIKSIAEVLANFLHKQLDEKNIKVEGFETTKIIIPIPISQKKLKERGYNQSELIASALSRKLNFKIYSAILYKKRHTLSQVETKNRKERLKNLKNSFAVQNAGELKNASVLLIDDIVTTGATLNEAAKTLKQNGAKRITGIVVAKS